MRMAADLRIVVMRREDDTTSMNITTVLTVIGCPPSAIPASNFPLSPPPNQAGDSLRPHPAVITNAADDTDSNPYSAAAPAKAMCSTTSSAEAADSVGK